MRAGENPSDVNIVVADNDHSLETQDVTKTHGNYEQTAGEMRLQKMIDKIHDPRREKEKRDERREKKHNSKFIHAIHHSQHVIGEFLEQRKFHYFILGLVIVDIIVLFSDMVVAMLSVACFSEDQMELYNTTIQPLKCMLVKTPPVESAEEFLTYFSLALLCLFTIEIIFTFFAFGWRFYKQPLYFIDAVMILSSLFMEVYFEHGNLGGIHKQIAARFFLRIWILVRSFHAIAHSVSVINLMMAETIKESLEIIKEEKAEAHEKLEKREIMIEYLMNLLEKSNIHVDHEQLEKISGENVKKEQPLHRL